MWERELQAAKALAREAGAAIMEVYNGAGALDVEYKADRSPVTRADRIANGIIAAGLKSRFPDYAVLSEEQEDDLSRLGNERCFVVDPLDGTREFISKNGQFTVNIALSYRHRAVMGVIYVPVSGELYFASQGSGAFYAGPGGGEAPISVSGNTGPHSLRMVASRSHHSPELEALIKKHGITRVARVGGAIKGCMIAKGEADVYYRYGRTMEWDTAAMQCIVEQAGGILRQMDGSEMTYNRPDSVNRKGFYVLNRQENLMAV